MGIKNNIKRLIVKALPRKVKENLYHSFSGIASKKKESDEYINLSFSQEGEDLVLYRLIGHKTNGFYIDVGAHHPFRFSNTYKFYLMGWTGINIDPLPGSMEKFNNERPSDINLEIPILSEPTKDMVYYMFDEPALNTFDEKTAMDRKNNSVYKITNKVSIKPYRLDEILEKYLQKSQTIDFISVDVEGMDMEVLSSNNWEKFRPNYIITESISTNLKNDFTSDISCFLAEKKYELIAKTANSLIYARSEK